MRRLFFAVIMICLTAAVVSAQDTEETAGETIPGTIIDNMCASTQAPATLGDFVANHTKSCALMPQCAASGYSLYSNGRLMKFDDNSNPKIEEFLRSGGNVNVIVEVTRSADGLGLVSIKDQ